MVKEVRIEDLREPRRTVDEQAFYEFALRMEVDLGVDGIVADAQNSAGLSEFGDPSLLDRLAEQVGAVEADVGLSGLGRYIVRERLVGLLKARLRFEDFVRRHPEALEIELAPPIIVVGLPRSGTTHLVNLLAADSRFRSMPWWEVVEPIPIIGDGPGRDGIDPRFARCLDSLQHDDVGVPAGGAHARSAPVEHRGGLRARRPRSVLLHTRMARHGSRRGATTTSASIKGCTTLFCARSFRC